MEKEANYAAVGAFVLLILAMGAAFVLWYSNAQDRRDYVHYEVYFEGSVSGLSEGSAVRYLGVDVGRVARIRLDPRDRQRVQVRVDLDSSTPIAADTVARLRLQGVTGLLFIELALAPIDARRLGPTVASERYPVIRSEPSELDRFVSNLPGLELEALDVAKRVNRAFSDQNLESLSAILSSMRATADSLPEISHDVRQLLAHANGIVTTAGPEMQATVSRLHSAADALASSTARIDGLLARHQEDFDHLAGEGVRDLQGLLHESREAATEMHALTRALREDPSRVIYRPAPHGHEIPP